MSILSLARPGIGFLQIELINTDQYYVASRDTALEIACHFRYKYEASVNFKGKIRFKIQIVFLIKNLVLSSKLTKRYKFFPLIVAF